MSLEGSQGSQEEEVWKESILGVGHSPCKGMEVGNGVSGVRSSTKASNIGMWCMEGS